LSFAGARVALRYRSSHVLSERAVVPPEDIGGGRGCAELGRCLLQVSSMARTTAAPALPIAVRRTRSCADCARSTTSNASLASAPTQCRQPLRRFGGERVRPRALAERADAHRALSRRLPRRVVDTAVRDAARERDRLNEPRGPIVRAPSVGRSLREVGAACSEGLVGEVTSGDAETPVRGT
jgi:hypothetical protein